MSRVAETKKPPRRARSATDHDTQLGYYLGYFCRERADFELKMALFGAEGGIVRDPRQAATCGAAEFEKSVSFTVTIRPAATGFTTKH
jgi:hypothetical protein